MQDKEKIHYERLVVAVTGSGQTQSPSFVIDDRVKKVIGISAECDNPAVAYFRSSQRLEINGDEIFPENFETRRLISSVGTPVNERFYDLGEVPAGNKKVVINHKDTNSPMAAFGAYSVVYILKCIR